MHHHVILRIMTTHRDAQVPYSVELRPKGGCDCFVSAGINWPDLFSSMHSDVGQVHPMNCYGSCAEILQINAPYVIGLYDSKSHNNQVVMLWSPGIKPMDQDSISAVSQSTFLQMQLERDQALKECATLKRMSVGLHEAVQVCIWVMSLKGHIAVDSQCTLSLLVDIVCLPCVCVTLMLFLCIICLSYTGMLCVWNCMQGLWVTPLLNRAFLFRSMENHTMKT